MKFQYVAFDSAGTRSTGSVDASDERAARASLGARGLFVSEIGAASDDAGKAPGRTTPARSGGRASGRLKHVSGMARQLAVLVVNGTPIVDALGALERQTSDKRFLGVLRSVRQQVEEGIPLAEAMRAHPQWFDSITVSLVAAGEAGGKLGMMLDRLSSLLRRQLATRNAVTGAMVYPMLLIVVAVSVLTMMVTVVLPRFGGLFESLGMPLPPSTAALLSIGQFLRAWWWVVLLGVAGSVTGLVTFLRTPQGVRVAHRAVLKLPVVGSLARSFVTARIARLLGILLESRVPMLDAIDLTRAAAGNLSFADLLTRAEEALTRGEQISHVFMQSDLVSPAMVEAIRNGERTGAMGPVLTGLAEFLDEDNEVMLKAATSLIEPVILIIMGVLVGIIAVSMFMPLFDLTSMTQGPAPAGGGG
ncbi:MAG: type II secretion system F family protein [Phycisphaerales bacterium]|jgi:type II secretory pathway component PulF|nr:type II secretion system F family protein [Phycisphaerales bacterium]